MTKGRTWVWPLRVLIALLVLLFGAALALWVFLKASLPQVDGTLTIPDLHDTVSVARDAHGVPLISGKDRRDVAYATGFVHGQERYFQMDLLRRSAAGELAELFGERALKLDLDHRLHRFRARAEQGFQALPAADRELFERYAAGVNDGLNTLKARPFEYALAGAVPRPWSGPDSLLVIWSMYLDLQGNAAPRELARGWLRAHSSAEQLAFLLPTASEWDAPLDVAGVAAAETALPAGAPDWWGRPVAAEVAKLAGAGFPDALGSNNWAVAGSRSADGAAIVSNDMHLGIMLPNTWYRLALQFPDADGKPRRMVGVSLPGTPLVVVGSNGHVAWGFTNSYGDYLDLVALGSAASKPGQLRTPAGWETPSEHIETILVKGQAEHKLLVRDTAFGPVREVGGQTYAVHWTAHQAGAVNVRLRQMETADTVADALAVAATLGVPAQNFVAGDDRGNIGWTIAGLLPKRAQSGAAAMAAVTFPLATDDPAALWQGWLAPADYPRVLNPAGGQLWTANSRQLMGPGAERIGDGGFDIGARSQQIRDDLRSLGAKTDVRSVYSVTMDDRAIFQAGWRERAIAALDVGVLVDHPKRVQFLHLLKSDWSGHASVDSAGYRLTRDFMHAVYGLVFEQADAELAKLDPKASVAAASPRWPVPLARLLDEQPAAWLPPQYRSWQALEVAAIDRVIADLGKDRQPLSAATWGARNTVAIAHPFAASVPLLGRWLAAPPDQLAGDGNMPRLAGPKFGPSERLTVTPGKEEQGVFNMPGGQSGNPLSPFFLAGHADWVAGKPTPLLPGPAVHTLTFEK